MITALEIENFKSFGKRQRIEIKPITLLFGPNSAGKSSIIQALCYLDEVLNRNNFDAHITQKGGEYVNLGGFRNIVHNHDISQSIKIKVEMSTEGMDVEDWPECSYEPLQWVSGDFGELFGQIFQKIKEANSVSVGIGVSYDPNFKQYHVSQYSVAYDGIELLTIDSLAYLNFSVASYSDDHPIMSSTLPDEDVVTMMDEFENLLQFIDWNDSSKLARYLSLQFSPVPDTARSTIDQFRYVMSFDGADSVLEKSAYAMLSYAMFAPAQIAKKVLNTTLHYIGPFRKKPERNYKYTESFQIEKEMSNATDWSSGIAAWDRLHHKKDDFIGKVSDWMSGSDPNRLNTGYSVHLRSYYQIDTDDPVILGLMSDDYLDDIEDVRHKISQLPEFKEVYIKDIHNGMKFTSYDVGEGITQLLPIVVGVLDLNRGILAIEQPELHIHPRIQVAVGDLLIEGIQKSDAKKKGDPKSLLIETHSEHLLYRLLKRIRQTSADELPPGVVGLNLDDLGVFYVKTGKDGSEILPLRVDETGEFYDQWPDGFFEERAEELF